MLDPIRKIVYTDSDAKPSRFLVDLNKSAGKPDLSARPETEYLQAFETYTKASLKDRVNDFLSEKKDLHVEFLPGRQKLAGFFGPGIFRKLLLISLFLLLFKLLAKSFRIAGHSLGRTSSAAKKILVWQPDFERLSRPAWPRPFHSRAFKPRFFRELAFFTLVMLAVAIPLKAMDTLAWAAGLKDRVVGASESAALEMQNAAENISGHDWEQARRDLRFASEHISSLESDIARISDIMNVIGALIPIDIVLAGRETVKAADMVKDAASISRELAYGLSGLDEDIKLSEAFVRLKGVLARIAPPAARLEAGIAAIDTEALPEKYQSEAAEIKAKALLVARGTGELDSWFKVLSPLLGFEKDRRYLMVFQNNAEMRASGGFIGSYALADLRDGEIRQLEVPGGGSYDTEAGLLEAIRAPEPLRLVRPRWFFWDANWWPDWPMTARKLMSFLEKSDGPSVDGVISFTPAVMEKFLEITGPIDLSDKYGLIVDNENFWEITQALAERKPDETDKPKQIIGDLMAGIIEQLPARLDKKMILDLLAAGLDLCDQKQILLYFNDEAAAAKLAEYDWTGAVKPAEGDYLLAVNTNIAGAKSDRNIDQEILHNLEIGADGRLIATTRITRSHKSNRGEGFAGQRNVNWLRLYVPLGSELVSAQGFKSPDRSLFKSPEPDWTWDPDLEAGENRKIVDEASGTWIYAELGKTVFANWSMIDPGEVANIYVKYKLPENIRIQSGGRLDLLFQKQPGMPASRLKVGLALPENLKLAGGQSNYWTEIDFDMDQEMGLDFE